MMLKYLLLLFSCGAVLCCPREPSPYHSRVGKSRGNHGFQIKINENPKRYVPGQVYTMYLTGSKSFERVQEFRRFIINVESAKDIGDISPQRVGSFQLFGDALSHFNEDCVNTLSETSDVVKTEVFFMWKAPPPGSGCVTFRAMVLEDAFHWYADNGGLSKEFCERTEKDIKYDPHECCACDEAKYKLIFEGIWSNRTHPRDFPFSLWLTHFSDVIGASHERNFTFWGEGQLASEGFRSLAEWGSVRLMETELRAKSRYLRNIVKAPGLWYPKVNTNTTTTFKVDRRHNLVSLASMLGPSPDWVVGVDNLNLCQKDCTWIENLIVDLYPYDAGTDSGITYMSPNAETKPRERMYRITTTYPEDPRAPFYDPSKSELPIPLAKFYFYREKVVPKSCDENFLFAQIDESDNTEDSAKPECAVTEYSAWSECSVTCGKGLSMRTREYRMPQKAAMFGCSRQLVSKEMCVAAIPECEGGSSPDSVEETLDSNDGMCMTTPWTDWSECSESCGVGFKSRSRQFKDRAARKKCTHVELSEREKCMGPPCSGSDIEVPDPMCPVTEWSDWSPCSATCGKGVKMRMRLLLVEPGLQQKCSMRIELVQQRPCVDKMDCTFDMATAKEVCMEEYLQGPCTGVFNRWYFEPRKLMCVPFQYGGCKGNRNNFLTAQECNDACRVVRDALSGSAPQEVQLSSSGFDQSQVNGQQYGNSNEPIDCMVTDWAESTPCNVSCGSGLAERIRMIKRPAANGGRPCPRRLVKRVQCHKSPCSRY